MRVVLDTNVLISTLLWKGRLAPIYHLINERKIVPCFSRTTFNELIRVAKYPHIVAKTKKEKINLEEIIEILLSNSIIAQPREILNIIKEDPFDNNFLACATSCRASFIVSGDKHLLKLRDFQAIPIVSPKEFLKIMK